jgi:acetyl-CoA C-acetyltransferase
MKHFNRDVAIVGIGQTKSTARRPDVNQLELVNEAVVEALNDAGLSPKDIDVNFIGDMELFQGDYQSDMWHVAGYGGYLRPGFRATTGGTTGGMLVCDAQNFVASGMYDTAICIGFQKHDEGNASTGLTSAEESMWYNWTGVGVGGAQAEKWVQKYGTRIEEIAAKLRVQMSINASKNPKTHLRKVLTVEEVMNSPVISYPLRLLHLCPQSTAACALILASEKRAREITKKPVWIKDYVVSHYEEMSVELRRGQDTKTTMRDAAEKLYKRNGISDPVKEIDVMEIYDPFVWIAIHTLSGFLLKETKEIFDMIEQGAMAMDGEIPINPSGGVMCSNPIGATSMIRVAEAALQVRGDAANQVPKEVNTALASSFGGTVWTILHLLSKTQD